MQGINEMKLKLFLKVTVLESPSSKRAILELKKTFGHRISSRASLYGDLSVILTHYLGTSLRHFGPKLAVRHLLDWGISSWIL